MDDDLLLVYRSEDVFVPGLPPAVTYNPRESRSLEREIRTFIRQPGRALSVHGPTKSGKTVLVEAVVPKGGQGVWIQGDEIQSVEDFWQKIAHQIDLFSQESVSTSRTTTDSDVYRADVDLVFARGGAEAGQTRGVNDETTRSRVLPVQDLVRDELRGRRPVVTIVIDDFHYLAAELRQPIARAIKSLIRVAPVILIAVPANAFDAVKGESEMGGRVLSMEIQPWTRDELEFIAVEGFKALNVSDPQNAIAKRLAEASFGAPFLMQQLCLDLMDANYVEETAPARAPHRVVAGGGSWESFFQASALKSIPDNFKRLLRGPDPRGQERRLLALTTGHQADIYGAIFAAIAGALPTLRFTTRELSRLVRQQVVLPPKDLKLAGRLQSLSEIAEELRGAGDPMLVFNEVEFHIQDPFLAFYIKWGPWRNEYDSHPVESWGDSIY